jgi:hypothetical protein
MPKDEEKLEELPFAPPETHYVSERYIIEVPANDIKSKTPWKLRLYATKQVERKLGDTAQVTSFKVKKPHLVAKSKAKLLKRPPQARLFVTVKF